jgi:hypothetical protein
MLHRTTAITLGLVALVFGCEVPASSSSGDAQLRVAHLSPDAPAVDFCVAEHGTKDFTGPVLASNGAAAGLSYSNVTKYIALPAAQYDVRLVAPGSSSCATSLGGLADFTNLPALPSGANVTLAAEGLAGLGATPSFTLQAYVDDTSVDAGKAKLRFIHASPNTPAVDVGTGGGALFQALFTDVSYGSTSGTANGYVVTAPLSGVEISARAFGSLSDAISINPAVLPAGAIATAFAIGELDNASTPLRVLLCVDNGSPNGILSQCSVVGGSPSRAHVRIGHLSPDLRAVDVCLAPAGTTNFSPPVLAGLGVQDGLTYAAITRYVDLPVGSYDVRVILANATGCSIPAIPDTKGITVTNDETVSVLALGDFDNSGAASKDPPLRLQAFTDATSAPSGSAKLRFVHASPGTPAVDVGLGSGATFTKVFANVSFGNIATNAPVDSLGFATTSAPVTSAVAARLAGQSTDALVVPSVTLPAQGVFTAFAIGGKTGASDNPLQVLLCDDNATPTTLLSTCTLAN